MSLNLVVRLTRVGSNVHRWAVCLGAKRSLLGDEACIQTEENRRLDTVVAACGLEKQGFNERCPLIFHRRLVRILRVGEFLGSVDKY